MEYTFGEDLLFFFVTIAGLAYAILSWPFRILYVFITGSNP